MREERADQTEMEVCPETTGECCNCDADEILSWYATVGGIKTEQYTAARIRDVQAVSQVRKVIDADIHQHDNVPQAKRDGTQPRVATLGTLTRCVYLSTTRTLCTQKR